MSRCPAQSVSQLTFNLSQSWFPSVPVSPFPHLSLPVSLSLLPDSLFCSLKALLSCPLPTSVPQPCPFSPPSLPLPLREEAVSSYFLRGRGYLPSIDKWQCIHSEHTRNRISPCRVESLYHIYIRKEEWPYETEVKQRVLSQELKACP